MSKLDLTKPVQTRSGLKVTLLKTDLRNNLVPIIAVISRENDDEVVYYTAEGRYYISDVPYPYDLVNVPEVTTQYCNLYSEGDPCYHDTLEKAERNQIKTGHSPGRATRIACLKITKTDGVITDVSLA